MTEIAIREEQPLTAEDMRQQVNLIQEVMKAVMIKDIHFGKVPGCGDKPTLLKPGAEKLSLTFRLAPKYEIEVNHFDNGHREYEITCNLEHINSGLFFGSGVGVCSTLEGKFRFRTQSTGKEVPKDYWKSRDVNLIGGNQFSPKKVDNKWIIFEKIEHDNPADYYNTVKKMAKKRAHVDAVLTATGASDIFTQDIEDMPEVLPATEKKPDKEPIKQAESKTPDTDKPAPSGDIISEPQRKRLFAISKKANVSEAEMKEFISFYGFESSKDITKDVYQEICEKVEVGNVKVATIEGCNMNPAECDHSEYQGQEVFCKADKGRVCKFNKESSLA